MEVFLFTQGNGKLEHKTFLNFIVCTMPTMKKNADSGLFQTKRSERTQWKKQLHLISFVLFVFL